VRSGLVQGLLASKAVRVLALVLALVALFAAASSYFASLGNRTSRWPSGLVALRGGKLCVPKNTKVGAGMSSFLHEATPEIPIGVIPLPSSGFIYYIRGSVVTMVSLKGHKREDIVFDGDRVIPTNRWGVVMVQSGNLLRGFVLEGKREVTPSYHLLSAGQIPERVLISNSGKMAVAYTKSNGVPSLEIDCAKKIMLDGRLPIGWSSRDRLMSRCNGDVEMWNDEISIVEWSQSCVAESLSLDGRYLYVSTGDHGGSVMDLGTEYPRLVATLSSAGQDTLGLNILSMPPIWSPSSRSLAFLGTGVTLTQQNEVVTEEVWIYDLEEGLLRSSYTSRLALDDNPIEMLLWCDY